MATIIHTVNGVHQVVENLDDIKTQYNLNETEGFVTLTEIVGPGTEWENRSPLWLNWRTVVSASALQDISLPTIGNPQVEELD